MLFRNKCSAWLGLAGACLFVIGCGGGDVPDPGSDAKAADGNTPGGGGARPQAAAPAQAVAAADQPKADEAAPAQGQGGDASKDQSKGQGGNSTTSEMLALSGGPSSPPAGGGSETPPPAAPGAPAPGGPPAPGGGGGPGPGPNGPGAGGGGSPGGMVPGSGGRPNMGPNANADPSQMMAQQMQMQQRQMQARGGNAGGGAPGGAAGAQNKVAEGPADVSTPVGAVRTFLNALKARDADRLAEATARRAAVESATKNQDTFTKILEISLSDSALDELAKKLEGYEVAYENPAKSTGKVDVVIQKSTGNGARSTRKVTVRREKKGWGVLDIGGSTDFSPLGSGARKTSKSR